MRIGWCSSGGCESLGPELAGRGRRGFGSRWARGALLAGLLVSGSFEAVAGTRLVMETSRLSDGKVLDRTVLRADGDRLRIDADEGRTSIVYLADRALIWMLDHEERSYVEVDPQTTTKVTRQLSRIEREMRARLATLPAKQRAAAERLLDRTLGPEQATERPEVVLVPTGGRERIDDFPCREFDLLRGGTKVADLCKAEFSEAGVDPASLASVQRLAAFLGEAVRSIAPSGMQGRGLDALDSFTRLDGIPMRVRAYEKGVPVRQSIVTELATPNFADADFALPEGYARKLGIKVREGLGAP